MAHRGQEREGDDRGHRGGRQQTSESQQREKQIAIWIAFGVGGLFLAILVIILVSSSSSSPPERQPGPLGVNIPPPPPRPAPQITTRGTAYALRTAAPVVKTAPRTPSLGTRAQRMERTYEAAKRRAETYAKDGRWGKAIEAIQGAEEEFEDLRFRTSDMLDDYREKARAAFRAAKLDADKLFEEAKFDAAIKTLKEASEKAGTEREIGEAKRKIEEIQQRKTVEAAANFVRCMTPVEQDISTWNFQGALDKATKLHFDEPEHQQQLEARLERIRFLIDLRKKMCDTVNGAMPKLTRKELRVPGGLDGDLMEASHDRIVAEGAKGNDQIPWPKFGPEATMNLALRAGKKDDPNYRITVARLLMEVGYYEKAKIQLTAAKKMGAEPKADEDELERRIQEAAKAKEKAEEPKAEPKADTKADTKGEPKAEPNATPKAEPKAAVK